MAVVTHYGTGKADVEMLLKEFSSWKTDHIRGRIVAKVKKAKIDQ